VLSPGSAGTNVRRGEKLNGHLMASCIENNPTKNYQNLISGFQVTVENVGDVFETQCSLFFTCSGTMKTDIVSKTDNRVFTA